MVAPIKTSVRRARRQPDSIAPRRRVTWDDPDQLHAMVLAAFGINPRVIAEKTGLTLCQVLSRRQLAGIRVMDYRNMKGTSISAQIARGVVGELCGRYTNVVRDKLPARNLPTQKESRHNGNGTALTLAHGGRGIHARD